VGPMIYFFGCAAPRFTSAAPAAYYHMCVKRRPPFLFIIAARTHMSDQKSFIAL
jgi:hypothetical protein